VHGKPYVVQFSTEITDTATKEIEIAISLTTKKEIETAISLSGTYKLQTN